MVNFPYSDVTLEPPPMTAPPDNQVAQHLSDASRVLKARGSPYTPRALNLCHVSNMVQNDGEIPVSARELIQDLIDFTED